MGRRSKYLKMLGLEGRLFSEWRVQMLESTNVDRTIIVKACELFIPSEKKWDVKKVSNLFQSCDAKAILATPIPNNQVCDRVAWTYALDGKYSVKSGYRYCHLHHSTFHRVNQEHGWNNLWKAEVPHKVKKNLWRLCRNNVPVRNLLRGKGV